MFPIPRAFVPSGGGPFGVAPGWCLVLFVSSACRCFCVLFVASVLIFAAFGSYLLLSCLASLFPGRLFWNRRGLVFWCVSCLLLLFLAFPFPMVLLCFSCLVLFYICLSLGRPFWGRPCLVLFFFSLACIRLGRRWFLLPRLFSFWCLGWRGLW